MTCSKTDRRQCLETGERDALALMTATDAEDSVARQLIFDNACHSCLTEGLTTIALTLLDMQDMTVAQFVKTSEAGI